MQSHTARTSLLVKLKSKKSGVTCSTEALLRLVMTLWLLFFFFFYLGFIVPHGSLWERGSVWWQMNWQTRADLQRAVTMRHTAHTGGHKSLWALCFYLYIKSTDLRSMRLIINVNDVLAFSVLRCWKRRRDWRQTPILPRGQVCLCVMFGVQATVCNDQVYST